MHVQYVCRGVAGATSERYGTARWNECVLSKPCRGKLIPAPDVNLSIELLCGGAMLTPDGVEVKAVSVCVCVREWCSFCPFQMSQKGQLLRSRLIMWAQILCTCVCVCHGNLPYSALQTHHSYWCVCADRKGCSRVCAPSLFACSSPALHPIFYSLIASLIIVVHRTVQRSTNRVFKTTSAYHKFSKWIFIYFFPQCFIVQYWFIFMNNSPKVSHKRPSGFQMSLY